DFYFERANVTYFASAGDAPGVSWPASSPQVIGVGGTTWSRNQITGFYQSEGVWNDWAKGIGTGGGPSEIYSTPTYQQGIVQIVGEFRGTPDIAALADPYNGVWVFNSLNGGWQAVGGTSLASPVVAGIFNRQGWFFPTSFAALTNLYTLAAEKKLAPYVTDVNNGFCGPGHLAYPASNGNGYDPAYIEATTGLSWDWCTGWGTPRGPH
ncbi:MAG TPA: hypothetical protein VEH77_11365, partial [Roseiarcus sp.]|nr:hypothetical protein [Roseiarcus sp.]